MMHTERRFSTGNHKKYKQQLFFSFCELFLRWSLMFFWFEFCRFSLVCALDCTYFFSFLFLLLLLILLYFFVDTFLYFLLLCTFLLCFLLLCFCYLQARANDYPTYFLTEEDPTLGMIQSLIEQTNSSFVDFFLFCFVLVFVFSIVLTLLHSLLPRWLVALFCRIFLICFFGIFCAVFIYVCTFYFFVLLLPCLYFFFHCTFCVVYFSSSRRAQWFGSRSFAARSRLWLWKIDWNCVGCGTVNKERKKEVKWKWKERLFERGRRKCVWVCVGYALLFGFHSFTHSLSHSFIHHFSMCVYFFLYFFFFLSRTRWLCCTEWKACPEFIFYRDLQFLYKLMLEPSPAFLCVE